MYAKQNVVDVAQFAGFETENSGYTVKGPIGNNFTHVHPEMI